MDVSDVYKESCAMFLHYSRISLMILITAIVQGIIVLSASEHLYRSGEFKYATISSIFGILFTLILRVTHVNYQHKCEIIANVAIKIEESIDKSVRLMTIYEKAHENKNKTIFGELFVINGFFNFMILAFLVLFMVSLYSHYVY